MTILEWPGTLPVEKKRRPTYEWAAIKAALEGAANSNSFKAYEKMFGEAPKKSTPFWLVRLAIYYGALKLGYARTGIKMPSTEERMFSMVKRLDESALRNDKILWHHMYLHDVEPAIFGGRELVS